MIVVWTVVIVETRAVLQSHPKHAYLVLFPVLQRKLLATAVAARTVQAIAPLVWLFCDAVFRPRSPMPLLSSASAVLYIGYAVHLLSCSCAPGATMPACAEREREREGEREREREREREPE